jgi:hypothetical protein
MKFLDIINESEEERLLKRGKTIFKAFKEGTITRTDGVSFSYVLDNNVEMMVRNGELELYGSVSKIVEKTYCPINERYMTELIENRFRKFYITTDLRPPSKGNIHKFQGKKPWEEDLNDLVYLNESNEDKLIRKGKLIFKALRKGTIGSEDEPNKPMFTYELSNDMSVSLDYGQIIIFTDEVKIVELNEPCVRMSTDLMARKISKRFEQFKVILSHPPIHPFNVDSYYDRRNREGLNENLVHIITDEDKKKVKLVHKAISSGVVKVNDVRYRYELPKNYQISPANNKIIRLRFEFYRGDLRGNNRGEKLPLKIWRLEESKDIYINGLLDNEDVSGICYGEHYHKKETTQEYMTVKNVVRRRYNNFNISLDVSPTERPLKTININLPINEQPDDVVITDDYIYPNKEQKKRAKIFYHAFKTGKFTVEDGGSYKYVLPNEYYVSVSGDGELNIVLTMNPQQRMKMYYVHKDHETGEMIEKYIDTSIRTHLYQWMKDSIENKFKQFQINFLF